jgi:opacity protein-like surface antigen
MMLRLLVIALAMVLAAAAPAAAAAARPAPLKWKQVGTTVETLRGDGVGVVWQPSRQTVAVDRAGGLPVVFNPPEGCGGFQTYGAGYLVYACMRRQMYAATFAIVNVDTGAVHKIDVDDRAADSALSFNAIGTNWMAGAAAQYHAEFLTRFVNWRTGAQMYDGDDPFGAHSYLDLSDPKLGHPLCSGMSHTPWPEDAIPTPKYESMVVSGRWALQLNRDTTFTLLRCGSKAKRQFSGIGQLGSGFLTWIGPWMATGRARYSNAMRLADGRKWRGPAYGWIHTADAIYGEIPVFANDAKHTYLYSRVMRAALTTRR